MIHISRGRDILVVTPRIWGSYEVKVFLNPMEIGTEDAHEVMFRPLRGTKKMLSGVEPYFLSLR